MAIKRYLPDLSRHAAICEANYLRLERLLHDCSQTFYQFAWLDSLGHQSEVTIRVIERFKYTTTLQLTHGLQAMPKPLNRVQLTVRLYADARMAEVVTPKQGGQLAGIYPYPNNRMYQIDEKEQLNHYLAEWLHHLMKQGAVDHRSSATQ